MKVGHFSDLHYCPEHLEEADRCFSDAVESAIEEGIEVAVISGDATDHRIDLHSPSAKKLSERIHTLSEHCPVLMLQGTFFHEPLGTLEVFQYIGGKFPVFMASDIQQVALTGDGGWVSSLSGDLPNFVFTEATLPKNTKALFSCLPTVNKAEMVSAIAADDHSALGDVLAELLAAFAPANMMAREKQIPTITVSHGTVHGCLTEHGVPMIGFDHEFTVGSLFATKSQATMLGHIHKHQIWENELPQYGTQRIAYAGSIGRLHFGEEGDKGWLFWEVDYRNAACVLMPTPAKKLLHIDFDGLPDVEIVQKAIAENQGSFVRIRYNVPEDQRHSVDASLMQKIAEQAGAKSVKVEGRIIPVVRVRAEGISQCSSLESKLMKWCETTSNTSGPLVGRLRWLVNEDPEMLVSGILSGKKHLDADTVAELPDTTKEHTSEASDDAPFVMHDATTVTPDVTPSNDDVTEEALHVNAESVTKQPEQNTPAQEIEQVTTHEIDVLDLF